MNLFMLNLKVTPKQFKNIKLNFDKKSSGENIVIIRVLSCQEAKLEHLYSHI